MATILTIDQLITSMTPIQIKSKIYEILAQLNVSTTNWKPGGVVRLMVAAVSIVLSAFSVFVSLIARSAFLTMSSGAWLTLVARHVFFVERAVATFASGSVTLVNSGGGSYDPDIGELVISNSITGKTYRNTERFAAPLTSGNSVTVAIRADEAGSGSSSGPNTITHLVTPLIGVTCTNGLSLVGQDEQTDDSLISECMLKPQSLSPNGARGAYEFFAKNALRSDGTSIGINRVTVSNSSLTGAAIVTVATASGAVTGTPSNYATDLGAIFKNIAENSLPGCVTLSVQSAATRPFNIQFWAYFKDITMGADDQVRAATPAIDAWMSGLDIGGANILDVASHKVFRDTLRDIISGSFSVRPTLVVITNPSADVTLNSNEVAVRGTVEARVV
jgi:phage-related baseplate assembly protein